jgi:hypothetical protein
MSLQIQLLKVEVKNDGADLFSKPVYIHEHRTHT